MVFTFLQIKANYAESGFVSNPWQHEAQSTAVRLRYGMKSKVMAVADLLDNKRSKNWLYEKLQEFEKSVSFERFIYFCIIVNAFFSASASVGMSQSWIEIVSFSEALFVWVFVLEALIRIVSQGVSYFGNTWNLFDFAIALMSLLSFLLQSLDLNISSLRSLRLFRALRLLRIFRRFESFRVIVDSAFASYKVMLNMFILMFFLLLVFSLLFMELFGNKISAADTFDGNYPISNFDTFWDAFLSILRVTTGDHWEII